MAAGTLEAIPLVGTGMYFARMGKDPKNHSIDVDVVTYHGDKFMPYKSLADRDFTIGGVVTERVEQAKKIFNENVNDNMSNSKKRHLAEEAVREAAKTSSENPSEL
jgi:hypothetical protein